MKEGFVSWLKADEARAKLLECKLKTMLEDAGHVLLFTVAYACWSQPIELFWAAGKNPVAEGYTNDRTLRDVVEQLRGGWYGRDGNAPFPRAFLPSALTFSQPHAGRFPRLWSTLRCRANPARPWNRYHRCSRTRPTGVNKSSFGASSGASADLGARVDAGVTGLEIGL